MQLVQHTLVSDEQLDYEGSSLLFLETYVDSLCEYGMYRREELPADALELYDLSHYEREVMNGGHAQYLGNGDRWKEVPGPIADSCLSGLRVAPSREYHDIYSQLCERLAENRQRAASIASTHGFSDLGTGYVDPVIQQLDRRFFTVNNGYALGRFNVSRFKRLKRLRPVPSSLLLDELASQIARNPYRVERKAAKALGRFSWIHNFQPDAIESLCKQAGCQFVEALMGGTFLEIKEHLTYGHVIETDQQRCFVCFRISRNNPRPLDTYRNDPLYLYSLATKELCSSSA